MQASWRWNLGYALLPIRFRLHAELPATLDAAPGVPTQIVFSIPSAEPGLTASPRLWINPYNRSISRTYMRLHVHREDDKYCAELPCGTAHHPRGAVDMRTRTNFSACSSMLECFTGVGGHYFYCPPSNAARSASPPVPVASRGGGKRKGKGETADLEGHGRVPGSSGVHVHATGDEGSHTHTIPRNSF